MLSATSLRGAVASAMGKANDATREISGVIARVFDPLVALITAWLMPRKSSDNRLVRWLACNTPNIMSVTRALLGLTVSWRIYHASSTLECLAWSMAVLLLIVSDRLDGELARKLKVVSRFGGFIDPLGDKLFILSLMYVLCLRLDSIALWHVVIILAIIEGLNALVGWTSGILYNLLSASNAAGATWPGKVKMTEECLIVFVGVALLMHPSADTPFMIVMCYATIPMAIGSLYGYSRRGVDSARQLLAAR